MDNALQVAFERFFFLTNQFCNPVSLFQKVKQNYAIFRKTLDISDHVEQVLLLAFTVLVTMLVVRFLLRMAKAVITFVVDMAKYIFLLLVVLLLLQYRQELQDFVKPHLMPFINP